MACYWWPLSRKLSPPPASMPQNSLQGFGLLLFRCLAMSFRFTPSPTPWNIFLWGLPMPSGAAWESSWLQSQAWRISNSILTWRPAWASGWFSWGWLWSMFFQVPQGIKIFCRCLCCNQRWRITGLLNWRTVKNLTNLPALL